MLVRQLLLGIALLCFGAPSLPAGATPVPTDIVLHTGQADAEVVPLGGTALATSASPATPTSGMSADTGGSIFDPLRAQASALETQRTNAPGSIARAVYAFVASTSLFALVPSGGTASASVTSTMQIQLADDAVDLDLSVSFANFAAGAPLSAFGVGQVDLSVVNLTAAQPLLQVTNATGSLPTTSLIDIGNTGDVIEIQAVLTAGYSAPLLSNLADGLIVTAQATFLGDFVEEPDPDPHPAPEAGLGIPLAGIFFGVVARCALGRNQRPARSRDRRPNRQGGTG